MLTIGYMMRLDTVSSHRVIGYHKGQHCQVVEDNLIAWHSGSDNSAYLGIEFTQPTPDDPFSQWQYNVGIAVVKAWSRKYGFPCNRWNVRRHSDTLQGQQNGKSDPGERFNYEEFIARLL